VKIISLETTNFRNLQNYSPYRFDVSPLTVIHGPNEAGKTSILEAIEVALFRKSDKKGDLDFMTRGEVVRPVVKLTVEHDGKQLTIERNYQDGKSYLKGGALDLKDEKQIGKIIHEMLGFDDPNTFQNLLIVRQNEMSSIDAKGIQKEIDTLVAGGSGGMTTTEILAELDSKLSAKRTAFKAADGKKYETINSSLSELESKKQELEAELESVQNDRAALDENRNELKRMEIAKSEAERTVKWLKAYAPYREAADTRKKVEAFDAQLALRVPELKRALEDIGSREEKLGDLRALRELEGRQELLAEQLKNIGGKKDALAEKKQQLLEIEKALAGKPVPPKADLKAFRNLLANIGQLDETLNSAEVVLRVRALKDIVIESSEAGEEMTSGQEKEYPFRTYEGLLTIRNTAGLSIVNKGLKQSSNDLTLSKDKLNDFVTKYGTDSVNEMEDRYLKQNEKERMGAEYDNLGGDIGLTNVQNEVANIEQEKNRIDSEIDNLRTKIGDATALEVEEGILKQMKVQLKEKEEIEKKLDGDRKSLLGQKKTEDLEKEIERSQIALAGLITTIPKSEQDRYMGLSTEGLNNQMTQLSEELEEIVRRYTQCDREVVRLTAELKNAPSYEDLVDVEEKLGGIRHAKEQADMYLKAFIALEEGLREAQAETRNLVSKGIDAAATRYFGAITQGKYDSVEVSLGDGIEVHVKEAGKADLISIDIGRPLSTGALQQLYFAIRVALVEALTGGKRPPLLFDDPFVDFDSDRRKEAVQTLVRLSQAGHQCIHLTCHDTMVVEGAGDQEVMTIP
jgi:DNA repair exonuclease SbcCD ATPase subunit